MDIGFIRPRKGLNTVDQRKQLVDFGCSPDHIWTIGNGCDTLMDVELRNGDRLVIVSAKLLTEPRKKRKRLHDFIHHLVALAVPVFDIKAGVEYSGKVALQDMADLVLAAPIGPNNGERGRPKIRYTPRHLEAAREIWRDIKTYRWNKDAVHAMNSELHANATGSAQVKPWTERRASYKFGASGRLTD